LVWDSGETHTLPIGSGGRTSHEERNYCHISCAMARSSGRLKLK